MTPVFLFAHQDDEFATFSALQMYLRQGVQPVCVYLTDGGAGGQNIKRRNDESLTVMQALGVEPERVIFLGGDHGIPDGKLSAHLDEVFSRLLACLELVIADAIHLYIPAWEGGHQDHDAAHLVGLALMKHKNLDKDVWQFSLYHGRSLPGILFKVLSPLKENGPSELIPSSLNERIRFLRFIFSYRSQLKTWIGLGPFVAFKLLFGRGQFRQPVSRDRCFERPHPGRLLYEKRGASVFEEFSQSAAGFIDRYVGLGDAKKGMNDSSFQIKPVQIQWQVLLALFVLALATRMMVALGWPEKGGDYSLYVPVAENILNNFCISYSPVEGGLCEPHWGGSHPPGFPIFIAAVWAVFGQSDVAIRWAQVAVEGIALVWFVRAIAVYSGVARAGIAAGLLIALSPLQIPYARFISTEILAVAAALWVFAEVLLSFAEKKLRVVPLGLAVTAAFFLRYDGAVICGLVALAAFLIHRPVEAIWRGALVAMILSVFVGGWLGRNVSVGLTPLPPSQAELHHLPKGLFKWCASWMTSQYDWPRWYYPMQHGKKYSKIRIPDRAYISDEEKQRVETLLKELSRYDGQVAPSQIDQAFENLLEDRKQNAPLRHYLVDPVKGVLHMLYNPYYSMGWPTPAGNVDHDERDKLMAQGVAGKIQLALNNPVDALIRGGGFIYRLGIWALFLAGALFMGRIAPRWLKILWLFSLSYMALRSLFFGALSIVDSRFLLQGYAYMETTVAAGLYYWAVRRKDKQVNL